MKILISIKFMLINIINLKFILIIKLRIKFPSNKSWVYADSTCVSCIIEGKQVTHQEM
jgi:hypothetical protein